MAPYLPQDRGAASPYSEGGALYALGLIHANHGQDIRQFILTCLRDTAEEVQHTSASPIPQNAIHMRLHACRTEMDPPANVSRKNDLNWKVFLVLQQ